MAAATMLLLLLPATACRTWLRCYTLSAAISCYNSCWLRSVGHQDVIVGSAPDPG
eukprot:COSAG01_NODE_3512_length_5986_cov_3.098182_4_plen_55_part_00